MQTASAKVDVNAGKKPRTLATKRSHDYAANQDETGNSGTRKTRRQSGNEHATPNMRNDKSTEYEDDVPTYAIYATYAMPKTKKTGITRNTIKKRNPIPLLSIYGRNAHQANPKKATTRTRRSN